MITYLTTSRRTRPDKATIHVRSGTSLERRLGHHEKTRCGDWLSDPEVIHELTRVQQLLLEGRRVCLRCRDLSGELRGVASRLARERRAAR